MPATLDDVSEAVTYMLSFADLKKNRMCDRAKQVNVRAIAKRGYTRAELMLAMQEVPFQNTYGEGFRLDVVDKVVNDHRELRSKLGRLLSASERNEITDAFPEIDPDCFHCAGYDGRNDPIYRYVEGRPTPSAPPTPLLEESTPAWRDGTATGQAIAGSVDKALKTLSTSTTHD